MLRLLPLLWALLAAPTAAQIVIQEDAPGPVCSGCVPGIKVSINSHGDPLQPAAGDTAALATFVDDRNGRDRVWSQVGSYSVYRPGAIVGVAEELDTNNMSTVNADEPGGPRSLYGLWLSGASLAPYLGSAALLVTSADGSRWRNGLWIDRADVGIRMGGTLVNAVGVDFGRTRLRMQVFTAPPPPPPAETVDVYAQFTAQRQVQLIAYFPDGSWRILATEGQSPSGAAQFRRAVRDP